MIVFDGEITGKCRKFVFRRYSNLMALTCIISMSIVSFLVIEIAKAYGMSILWFYIACAVMATVVLFLLPPGKQTQNFIMPKKVYVDLRDEMVVCVSTLKERFHGIDSVCKVIDYGEWYHFKFAFGGGDPVFVCQKSLLTEGTIQEFEALFEDIIVRKVSSKLEV